MSPYYWISIAALAGGGGDLLANSIAVSRFRDAVLQLLDETFETHHGIYTDRGTSLLETLDAVSVEEASAQLPDGCWPIAAHAAHVVLYLDVLEKYILTGSVGDVDWEEIWRTVRSVNAEEWQHLIAHLKQTYGRVRTLIEGRIEWDSEESLAGALAIVVHTAYHLGAIRQLVVVSRVWQA